MVLIEPVITEFAETVSAVATRTIVPESPIQVPRNCRGTLLGVFGSIITVDDSEQGFITFRLIADVLSALQEPNALYVTHLGIILVGTAAGPIAAPQVQIDRQFVSGGRGISILSTGARSNAELGWSWTTNVSVATSLDFSISMVYEYVLEWLDSGPTGDWEDDQDEEFSKGQG